jgi:hypothetical protein
MMRVFYCYQVRQLVRLEFGAKQARFGVKQAQD